MGEQSMGGPEAQSTVTQEIIPPSRNKGFLRGISRRILPVGLTLALGLSASSPAIQQPRPEMSPTLPNTELIPLATGTPHIEEIPLAHPPTQISGQQDVQINPRTDTTTQDTTILVPQAELIPLAHPGDDKVELIPLAHPGQEPIASPKPVILVPMDTTQQS